MLKIRNVNKTYKGKVQFKALHNISFELPEKGLYAILGPSGCGKTSLLNIIGGMDSDFEGNLLVNNRQIDANSKNKLNDYRKDTIGFIFQHAVLLNSLTVFENIIFPMQIDSQPSRVQEKRATEILKLLNIYDLRNRKVNTLSGGQKQRVVIARALINDPKIILADEPTGELDSKNSKIILDILQKLSSDRLIIMVTHEEKFAKDYALGIIKMKDGHIVDIIDNKENVKDSKLVFNLTKKVKSKKKAKLPFFTNLKIAFRSLGLHKARNILSSIGLAIGLTGIALSITLTNGFQRFIVDTLGGLKNENYVQISRTNENMNKQISDSDYNFIISNSDEVDLVRYQTYENPFSQTNTDIPLSLNDNTFSSLTWLLSYQYVNYDNNKIIPALDKPLEYDEVIIDSALYKDVCTYYDIPLGSCSINDLAPMLKTDPVYLEFDTTVPFLQAKNLKVAGFIDTTEYRVPFSSTSTFIFHTNTDFATEFIEGGPYTIVRNYSNSENALLLVDKLTYTNDLSPYDAINMLNSNTKLHEYYFYYYEYSGKAIQVNRTYYLSITKEEVDKIIKSNQNDIIGYVNSNFFDINNNKFSFNLYMFLSDDEELTDIYSNRSDYQSIPLDELPHNIFHTMAGNVFSFRPLHEDATASDRYYNIVGSVPSKESLDTVVISKDLADALLSGKPKNYESLIDTKLYGNVKYNNKSVSYTLTISGVALNEDSTSILSYGEWPDKFFESLNIKNERPSNDYTNNNSVYVFVKNNVNVASFISKLNEQFPDYTITNQIVQINNSIDSVLTGIRTVLIVLSSISILVAIMLISMVSFISIIERRQEVGVMRTMGARKFDIALLFVNETVIIGMISSTIAYIISLIVGSIINYIFQISLTVITLGLIKANFNIISFDIQALIVVFTTAIILSIIASILPALKISNIDPVRALKKK